MRNHGLDWAPYILETTISVPWKLVKHEAYPFNQHLIQWNLARFSLVLSGPLTLLSPAKHGRSEATHVEGCKVPTASNRLRRVEIDCYYSLLFWWLIWNPISKKNFSAAVDFDIFEYTKVKPPETNFHHLSPRTAAVARWRKSCVRPWQNAKAFCPRKAGCFGNVQRGVAQQCWENSRKSGEFHAKTWVAWWFQAFSFSGLLSGKTLRSSSRIK